MTKILFTDLQVRKLIKNKWIKSVSNKGITYKDEFKMKVVKETEDINKKPRQVFMECGIDPKLIGNVRIQNSAYRWRKQYYETGFITDTRSTNSGRIPKQGNFVKQ